MNKFSAVTFKRVLLIPPNTFNQAFGKEYANDTERKFK